MGARRRSTSVLAAVAVTLAVGSTILVVPSVGAAVRTDVPTPTPTTPTPTPTPTPTVPPKPVLPAVGVSVKVTPAKGARIGVAYPITATFSRPVQKRAVAERNMKVLVNNVKANGAWYWRSRTVALYRLPGFWPAHSRITVRMTLAKQQLAVSKTHRFLGRSTTTRTQSFTTGRKLVAFVNGKTHRMVVRIDGKKVRSFPASLGKAGYETRSGIKAVMGDKYAERRMTSRGAGITDPNDQYDVIATWAVRITPTGEFVHGAPWATSRLGVYNGSHGCTNLSSSSAKWFYDKSIIGDPVITTGTPRDMEPFNGLGAPYNLTWKAWLAKSVLKGAW